MVTLENTTRNLSNLDIHERVTTEIREKGLGKFCEEHFGVTEAQGRSINEAYELKNPATLSAVQYFKTGQFREGLDELSRRFGGKLNFKTAEPQIEVLTQGVNILDAGKHEYTIVDSTNNMNKSSVVPLSNADSVSITDIPAGHTLKFSNQMPAGSACTITSGAFGLFQISNNGTSNLSFLVHRDDLENHLHTRIAGGGNQAYPAIQVGPVTLIENISHLELVAPKAPSKK